MICDRILIHFNELFQPNDPGHPLTGEELNKAQVLKNAFVGFKDGKIAAVGEGEAYKDYADDKTEIEDYEGSVATPGLIDAHTHLVFGGSRENEFAMKLEGMEYLDILNAGGGILSTLKATKEASCEELYKKTKKLVEHMMVHGVTCVEAKSGYGNTWEIEEKELKVINNLGKDTPMEVVPTFMAAHVIPESRKDNPDQYVDEVIDMMPKVMEKGYAEYCDVFCEKDVFTAEQSKRVLEAAREHGMKLRIHSNEIESIGGIEVANELKVTSAEHLMNISDKEIQLLADAQVIGNLLPGTTFSLLKDTYAPARKMVEAGMPITLCTDANPGSCPTANLQFIMQLGCMMMKLTPIEVLNCVTVNASYSVGREKTMGSLNPGKRGNLSIFDCRSLDYLLYFFATNLCKAVYVDGKKVVKDRQWV